MLRRITDSQFHVWRTLCAIAHVDNIFKDEELSFISKTLNEIELTKDQTETLKEDIATPKDHNEMFAGISEKADRSKFLNLARGLVWADGEYVTEEKSAMLELKQEHLNRTDVDAMIGTIRLEFEDDDMNKQPEDKKSRFKKILDIFKEQYFDKL